MFSAVVCFTQPLAKLFYPRAGVDAVHNSPKETEPRRNVLAIPANVFFADASVKTEKSIHAARLAE
jgi:hypothetical protein